ncbi:hypothetical protein Acr_28g0000480 [Actinidia rufa]|uniref:Uncharacterized protein n=1 Tax=Actinidia rufa TaxID=165716 RepID=A0A7J0H8B3_9ERIC|nr:hypothetical protein Acr_28g0000480 [Actinidia rufa]
MEYMDLDPFYHYTPEKFNPPKFNAYDGKSDPSLGDLWLMWFEKLPQGSIKSVLQLSESLVARFVINTKAVKGECLVELTVVSYKFGQTPDVCSVGGQHQVGQTSFRNMLSGRWHIQNTKGSIENREGQKPLPIGGDPKKRNQLVQARHLKAFVDQEKTETQKTEVRPNPRFGQDRDLPLGTIHMIEGSNYPDLEIRIRRKIRIVRQMHEVISVQPTAKKPRQGFTKPGRITFTKGRVTQHPHTERKRAQQEYQLQPWQQVRFLRFLTNHLRLTKLPTAEDFNKDPEALLEPHPINQSKVALFGIYWISIKCFLALGGGEFDDLICLGKCDAPWLSEAMSSLLCRWLDREYLVHLPNNADLPRDLIFKIGVVWASNHVSGPEWEVFLQGIVSFIPISVKPRLGLASASFAFVFFWSMNSFRDLLMWGELLVIQLVPNLGEELVDWFFENHVDSLPHPSFTVLLTTFHRLNMPSPRKNVPEACSDCLTSSSNRTYISMHVIRSQRSIGGLSVKSSHSFSPGISPSL